MGDTILEKLHNAGTDFAVNENQSKSKHTYTKESRNIKVVNSNLYNTRGFIEPTTDKFDTYRTFYRKFPVIKHKIDTTSNFVVSRGFSIDGEDIKAKEIIADNMDNINLRSVLQSIETINQVDGNTYLNPTFVGSKLVKLDILDSKYMRVIPKTTTLKGKEYPVLGAVKGYAVVQNGIVVRTYKREDIIHIKHNAYGTDFYGISDLESITEVLETKHGIEQDISEAIFRNASPITLWRIGNAKLNQQPTSAAISSFAESILNRDPGEDVFANDLVAADVIAHNPANLDTAELVKHFDRESRLGFSKSFTDGEGSNRSIGDVHVEIYHMNVRSDQQEMGDQLQEQLFSLILKKNGRDMQKLRMRERPFIKFNDMRAEDRKEQAVRFRLYTDAGMSKKTAMKIVGIEEYIEEEEKNSEEQDKKEMEKMKQMSEFEQSNDQNGEKDGSKEEKEDKGKKGKDPDNKKK